MSNQDLATQLHDLAERFRNPTRLRVVVTAVAVALAYLAICGPLGAKIDQARRTLRDEELRETLGQDVETLRAQSETFTGRLAKTADVNECLQYILDGVRARPIRLVAMDSCGEEKLNPYHVLAIRLDVRGKVQHLDDFLGWLETNERLFRVDVITMAPSPTRDGNCLMQLRLLGLKT